MQKSATRAPEDTRRRILKAAFGEFYHTGFQGGSLNHIVDQAGTTKGALFHHFKDKHDLGYAVVEEIIQPRIKGAWCDPLAESIDPITDVKRAVRQFVKEEQENGHWVQGCPLNNLAQEMSPLDEGFHARINRLYELWRERYAAALARGIQAGTVRTSVEPKHVAALIVAAQMGIWGTGKSSRNPGVMRQAADGACDYLASLRP